jgi:putative sterol carrier protein
MAHPEVQEIIDRMPGTFQPDAAGDLEAVLQFNLTGDKATDFHVDIANGKCTAAEGKSGSPTTTFTADAQDYLDLVSGKADGMSLFMQGKLSVDGDMGLAMRLQSLFKAD